MQRACFIGPLACNPNPSPTAENDSSTRRRPLGDICTSCAAVRQQSHPNNGGGPSRNAERFPRPLHEPHTDAFDVREPHPFGTRVGNLVADCGRRFYDRLRNQFSVRAVRLHETNAAILFERTECEQTFQARIRAAAHAIAAALDDFACRSGTLRRLPKQALPRRGEPES